MKVILIAEDNNQFAVDITGGKGGDPELTIKVQVPTESNLTNGVLSVDSIVYFEARPETKYKIYKVISDDGGFFSNGNSLTTYRIILRAYVPEESDIDFEYEVLMVLDEIKQLLITIAENTTRHPQ